MDRRELLATILALPATTTITATRLEPFDLVVFESPGPISDESAARVKAFAEDFFTREGRPHVRCLVLGDGMTLSIVRDGARRT
jgi:hypothetical protein